MPDQTRSFGRRGRGEGLLSDLKKGGWGLFPFIKSLPFWKTCGGEL